MSVEKGAEVRLMESGIRPTESRDLIGQWIVDHEDRLDVTRLRRERLERLQSEMQQAGLGAMLLFDPVNLGYAVRSQHSGALLHHFYVNYAVVPTSGRPVLFDGFVPVHRDPAPADGTLQVRDALTWDYFPCGDDGPEAVKQWARQIADVARELGAGSDPLGFDRLDYMAIEALRAEGVRLADARVPLEKARVVKTRDELILIRQACAIADIAIAKVHEAITPGVTENQLFAVMAATNYELGGDHLDARLLTAGGNTNPWYRAASDRLIREGDLVAMDTDMAGPLGYFADISRTYLCGSRPSTEQRDAYKIAYSFIQEALPLFRPGTSFQEIAERVPQYPEDYRDGRYMVIAHGVGMSDEWPSIHFPDVRPTVSGLLQEGMVLSVEGLASSRRARESVKLEEQIIIRHDGPEVISLASHDSALLG